MHSAKNTAQSVSTAHAMDRVLAAERDAEASLVQARQQAHDMLERARQDALAAVNHALERVAAWQQAHDAALARRLAARREQADATARDALLPDEAVIARAVARVAARLTDGNASGDGHEDGHGDALDDRA